MKGWKARTATGVAAAALCGSSLLAGTLFHELVTTNAEAAGVQAAEMSDIGARLATAQAQESESAKKKTLEPGERLRASVKHGDTFGVVYIPRLGADWKFPLLEGTERDLLNKGVTHEPYTSMPGEAGNFGIAAHRITYSQPFRHIDDLREGDQVGVKTVEGWAVYAVVSHEIVKADNTSVYNGVPPSELRRDPSGAWMTMVACHPVWSSEKRYVVTARLIERRPLSKGAPTGIANG